MTRVIHIDELCRPADNSPLFSCQHLSLILLVTILYPSIHNKDTHYSLSKHLLFPIGARHIAIFKLSHQLPSQNKEIFRPLLRIKDSFKKIIIVKDDIKPKRNEDGILTIGLKDFLLDKNSLNY